jgi:hypothetical protein
MFELVDAARSRRPDYVFREPVEATSERISRPIDEVFGKRVEYQRSAPVPSNVSAALIMSGVLGLTGVVSLLTTLLLPTVGGSLWRVGRARGDGGADASQPVRVWRGRG